MSRSTADSDVRSGGDTAQLLADEETAQTDEQIVDYQRSPIDLLRALVFTGSALLVAGIARWARHAVLQLELDLVSLFDGLEPAALRLVSGGLQVVVGLLGIGIPVGLLVLRRFRALGYVLVGGAVGALATVGVTWVTNREDADFVENEVVIRAVLGKGFPTLWWIAGVVATFVVLAVFVSRQYRRAGAVIVVTVLLARLLVAVQLPADLLEAVLLGAAAGSAVLFVFGRPDVRPTPTAIRTTLRASGLDVADVRPADVEAHGAEPYFVTLADGSELFTKVLGGRERSADLMFRSYRFLRLKHVGDERPFSSLRRTVEHEALVSLLARDVGVRTPRIRAISEVGRDSMLLTYDRIDGRSFDALEPDAVDDDVLDRIWGQTALLRRHRIAHRDLRRANILLDDRGDCWLIDFDFSEVAASERLLDADTAQLLAAMSIAVGATRSVDAAVRVVGPAAVGASLRLLQPNALSGPTRAAMKERHRLLEELQEDVATRSGVETPTFEQLERFSLKTIFTVAMLAAVTYFLLPQFADLPGIFNQVRDAAWVWALPVVAMTAVSYAGAAMGIFGAVPDRVAVGPTFAAQVGGAFTGKIAPAGVGGMALNVRFLQRSGVDPAVATSGVGLSTVAGLIMHIALLFLFTIWGGRTTFSSIRLPRPGVLLLGAAAVLVLAGVAFAIPAVRSIVFTKLFPIIARAFVGIGRVLRRPGKVVLLFGGSAVVSLAYIASLYFAAQAFGMELGFVAIGAIYLAASAVATVAPTPGGLGALEAALIAGFIAAGVSKDIAVPTVFFYRLINFWLPILPGWLSFRWLRKEQYV